ncbi:glycosyltransferase 87 family protein [Actinoplanes sp. NPDC051470]|uniref:glycosyltransferase 87 family protein n=1 Tax=unclassified Actinoplanes TaxID=2626549 RepID=UPI0034445015
MTNRRQAALVIGATVAVGVFLATIPTFRHFFDLGVYRGAVQAWLLHDGDLYRYRYQGTEYGFTYPPFAAIVLAPLAWTSWPVAVAAGLVVNTAMVGLLMRWYVMPVLRNRGWTAWSLAPLIFLAFLLFEPSRDTFSYGQINLVLLVLVCADQRNLDNGRSAGWGIGLAAAIKLTPAVFIGYLIIRRQYRAAATATATALGVTLITWLVAPASSATFWGHALWDTQRVGRTEYVSNQSLHGLVARLQAPETVWPALVALVLAFWWWTARNAGHRTGFALTGLVAVLISPISWVHHLVWLLPALFLLLERNIDRPRRLAAVGGALVIMSSSLVWLWWDKPFGWLSFPGSNAYVWITLGLLIAVGHPLIRRGSAGCTTGLQPVGSIKE